MTALPVGALRCPNCGRTAVPGTTYCSSCWFPLTSASTAAPVQPLPAIGIVGYGSQGNPNLAAHPSGFGSPVGVQHQESAAVGQTQSGSRHLDRSAVALGVITFVFSFLGWSAGSFSVMNFSSNGWHGYWALAPTLVGVALGLRILRLVSAAPGNRGLWAGELASAGGGLIVAIIALIDVLESSTFLASDVCFEQAGISRSVCAAATSSGLLSGPGFGLVGFLMCGIVFLLVLNSSYRVGPPGAPAPLGLRFAALLADGLFPMVATYGAIVIGALEGGLPGLITGYLVSVGFAISYGIVSWAMLATAGASFGKLIVGVRVSREGRAAPPGWGTALGRLMLRGLLAGVTFGVAGFSPYWDPKRRNRAWWDRSAGTEVVLAVGGLRILRSAATFGVSNIGGPPYAPNMGHLSSNVSVPRTPREFSASGVPIPDGPGETQPIQPFSTVPRLGNQPDVKSADWGDHFRGVGGVPGQTSLRAPEWKDPEDPRPASVVPSGPPPSWAALDSGALISSVPPSVGAVPEPVTDQTRLVPRSETAYRFVAHLDSGESHVIEGRALIGRDPAPDRGEGPLQLVRVTDTTRSVSKTHLLVGWNGGSFYVVDRHATNGVHLDIGGQLEECPAGVEVRVPPGARVIFGERSLTFVG
jgi:uncharacterized RDD family membrane protein YckC